MSDIIKLLPDSVANQIAAGEVIQRPASVIKELVENAVDAGATEIKLTVADAGKTMIQVIDNGTGMSETDARMAFERHATSKIKSADDLFSLRTMGFRGEALPSICAISEVDIRTRRKDMKMGTHLLIEGSKVISQEPCVCEYGTVFTVKRLFFNVPARRKFLKSDNVELSNIMREFERLALVNNNIRMSISTGTRQIDLRAGTLKQRIGDIWKNNINMQLVPVQVDTTLIKIEGFVSRPEFARRRNPLQFFFVNGRHMRHPYFHKAILSCFETLIASGTQPNYFLKFAVDPDTIDVNIHPTKNEIKFEYEQEIWPILSASIRAALGQVSAVPSIDFELDSLPIHPLSKGEVPNTPELELKPGYNPFKESENGRPDRVHHNWESLYDKFQNEPYVENKGFFGVEREAFKSDNEADSIERKTTEIAPLCMQFAEKYIITTSREGLLIIDQHRAHVKVLYEEYRKRATAMNIASQGVVFPEVLNLDESQRAALSDVENELKAMGYTLEYEDENKWLITGIPATKQRIDAVDVVMRVLDSVIVESENYGRENIDSSYVTDKIALVMARSGAIRRGTRLSTLEMEQLLGDLFSLSSPGFTPEGNKIYNIVSEERISRLF